MILIGKVAGPARVDRVKNGKAQALLIQVKFSGQNDVQTVQFVPQAGEDTNPPTGSIVVCQRSAGITTAVASWDGVTPTVGQGEKEIYSTDGLGNKKGRVKMTATGALYIANDSTGTNLKTVLQNILIGIQGGTYSSGAFVDTTGKLSAALTQLTSLLAANP